MSQGDDFFGLIGKFNYSLGEWERDLLRAQLETRQAKAAQLHVSASRDWLKTVVGGRSKYAQMMTIDQRVFDDITTAVMTANKYRPVAASDFVMVCGAVDEVLKCTYSVVREPAGMNGFFISEPTLYEKTLSVLPGDPDFPTDSGGAQGGQGRTRSHRHVYGYILPGDTDFPTTRDPGTSDEAREADLSGDPDFPTD